MSAAQACPGCFKQGDLVSGTVTGQITKYAGVDAYVVGSPDAKTGVVFAADIYGITFINNQKKADLYAEAGHFVVVPHTLNDPMDHTKPVDFSTFGIWLQRNPTSKSTEVCNNVVDQMKKEGKTKVFGLGFCYGARTIIDTAYAKNLDAVAVFHPTFMTEEDPAKLKSSGMKILFNLAEKDDIFTPALQQKFESELAGAAKFIMYPGTTHGFSVRAQGEVATKSAAEAHANTIEFLKSAL